MARSSGKRPARVPPAASPGRDIEKVLERIREVRNFDFRNYKRATLRRRIERRMVERRANTAIQYLAILDIDPTEYDALLDSMLIKVTSFFRDGEVWQAIGGTALTRMLADKRPGEEIRVWCAGCATGEEAFSVAILIAEALGPSFSKYDLKVFGTDVDEKAITAARRGFYKKDQLAELPKKQLADWFVPEGAGYCVRKEIRRCVVFGVNNLVSDAPISRLDMIWCRNVFIYLDSELQKRVLARFHYALRKNGLLVLGKSELIPFAGKIYEPVDLARRIYRKDGRGTQAVQQERLAGLLAQESTTRDERPSTLDSPEQFHADVLQSLKVPVVATSLDSTIMLWNPASAMLWDRPEADMLGKRLPSLNLPGLSGEILVEKSAAVREGRAERESGQGVLTRPGLAEPLQISVEVSPLRDGDRGLAGLLYVVQDVTSLRGMETELGKAHQERQSAFEELQTLNEEMQSSNEELETTNEELQSANEELQTTNEELQSTNEELETTNEELQSTNAELDATNRELAHRTEDLNRLGFCQRIINRSLAAAVIVLDPSGSITLWNQAAERLLGLNEGEAVGQSLWTLHVPALKRPVLAKVRKALALKQATRRAAVDYELPTGGLGHATLSAIPIIDAGTSLGAVVIFEDISRMPLQADRRGKKPGTAQAKGRRP